MKYTLNLDSISVILTLRYDPYQKPLLPKLTWEDFLPKTHPSLEQTEKIILEEIEERLNYLKNEKIALALSGGVDSTLILSLIKKTIPTIPIETISVRFADSIDETLTAKKIAQRLGVNNHIIHIDNYFEELPKAISIIQSPFWDLHWYYVAKKAKTLSNFIAAGDGGDELFGGYTFRYSRFLSLVNQNSSPLEKVDAYINCHERDSVPDQEKIFGQSINFSWEKIRSILLPFFNNPLPLLSQVFLADYNGKLLYNFSITNSKIQNYFTIKPITPLLSKKLINYTSHIIPEYKYDIQKNSGKIILRKLLKKLNLDSFVSDEKRGFSINTQNLWKSFGQKLCKDFLLGARITKEKWIDEEWIKKYISQTNLETRYINKFFGLLALEIWFRLFITKEIRENEKLSI